ncbi:hypothetical protein A6R68_10147 [Neotoma lepida]|uniref:Uncharacterized protein n=1 Tax=Neotoma lepida TaxID=56216 RepID=A0A1A6FXQ6_NEOLE|nr:hypothetical protein A6R68_10147 [Neotoma lepida]
MWKDTDLWGYSKYEGSPTATIPATQPFLGLKALGEGKWRKAFQALARFPSLRPTGDQNDPVTRPSDPSSTPHFSTTPRRYAPRERTSEAEKTPPGEAETAA